MSSSSICTSREVTIAFYCGTKGAFSKAKLSPHVRPHLAIGPERSSRIPALAQWVLFHVLLLPGFSSSSWSHETLKASCLSPSRPPVKVPPSSAVGAPRQRLGEKLWLPVSSVSGHDHQLRTSRSEIVLFVRQKVLAISRSTVIDETVRNRYVGGLHGKTPTPGPTPGFWSLVLYSCHWH